MGEYYIGKLPINDNYLCHHGILGQKWHVRRFQNKDGSLTPAGKARYGTAATARDFQKALNKNEKEYAYAVGDFIRGSRSGQKALIKMIKMRDTGKENSKAYEKQSKKFQDAANAQAEAKKRQEEYEAETWKLLGRASSLGYSTVISSTNRSTIRAGEQLVGALLLGGIGEGIREVNQYGAYGTSTLANKYRVRNTGSGSVTDARRG